MCRFLICKSQTAIPIADLITRPVHSITNQSFDSKLRVDMHRPLNGDGFGVGWYGLDKNEDDEDDQNAVYNSPCIFTSILPAWSNQNLIRLSESIKSPLIFAHVRAATAGFPVSELNCHPFKFGNFMFMHNGYISSFGTIKRKVQSLLNDTLFHSVLGNTDSEIVFALFLSFFSDPLKSFNEFEIRDALIKTISKINEILNEAGINEPSLMNFAVTDGTCVVCTRYTNCTTSPPASLYYSTGNAFAKKEEGIYKMVKTDKKENVIIISSEPLTFERHDWICVPRNSVVVLNKSLNLLIYPIKDEYYCLYKL